MWHCTRCLSVSSALDCDAHRQVVMQAGRQAGMQAGMQACRQTQTHMCSSEFTLVIQPCGHGCDSLHAISSSHSALDRHRRQHLGLAVAARRYERVVGMCVWWLVVAEVLVF
jgi:hypothetical protein